MTNVIIAVIKIFKILGYIAHQAKVIIPGKGHEMRQVAILDENIFDAFQY